MAENQYWADDPYWTNALESLVEFRQNGGRCVTIDLDKIDATLFNGDGPAYRLLEAMQSVLEREGVDGYRGAPRLVLALLWTLQASGHQDGG